MKKIKVFLLFVLTIIILFAAYKFNLNFSKKLNNQSMSVDDQTEFDKVKTKVDEEAIIKKALKAIGIMGVLEGQEEYKQIIEDEKWYAYRGINIDWNYRFSIAFNLDNLIVEVNNGVINFFIDNKKLIIWFIEKTQNSTSHSEASWFAQKYSSQEIEAIDKAVLDKITNKIKTTTNYWDEAQKSLKANLIKICNDMGYYKITFEEFKQ